MEPNEKRKGMTDMRRDLILLVLCTAALLIVLPVWTVTEPLSYWLSDGIMALGQIGDEVYFALILVLIGFALRSLIRIVNRLISKKAHFSLNWGLLLFGLLIGFAGIEVMVDGGIAMLFGLGLLGFGGWCLYRLVRDAKTQTVLSQDGETVTATIVEITHGAVSVNDSYLYTVRCEANGRYYEAKTSTPYDASYIGKMVPVQVSRTRPDIYQVKLDEIIWSQAEGDGAIPPEALEEQAAFSSNPTPDGDTRPEAASAAPETAPPVPEKGNAAEEKPAEPWVCPHPQDYIRIPWGSFITAATLLAVLWFLFSFRLGPMNRRPHLTDNALRFVLIVALLSLIIVLFGVLSLLRQRRLFFNGMQVRARVVSAALRYTYNGDPVYKVECESESARFSGKARLTIPDPQLVGKYITVFVSPSNPKDYIIEGRTASYS